MDGLSGLIEQQAVRGVLAARIAAAEDWGWWSPRSQGAAFHAVVTGTAWVDAGGAAPVQLMSGDVLLIPDGRAHALASDPVAAARTTPEYSDDYEVTADGTVRMGRGTPTTHILCAHYVHDPATTAPLLASLKEPILLRNWSDDGGLADTVRLVARELAVPKLGGRVVLARLVDVLLVNALRTLLEQASAAGHLGDERPSVLGALRDPVVSAAMATIDADPAHPWTITELARAAAVSRATLARRFPAALGESPAAYLTRRRLDLAARRLRDTDASVEQIARQVGYTSVQAFSRAFRRERAVSPGRFRAVSRTVGPDGGVASAAESADLGSSRSSA